MSDERIIGRDRIVRKITIFTYEDSGRTFYDLQTDGRILLTSKLAEKLAKELMLFAGGGA